MKTKTQRIFALTTIMAAIIFTGTSRSSAQSGTWITDITGNWSDTANWSGGTVADGVSATADFSTINLAAARTVTMDASHTLGSLLLSDTNTAFFAWTLVPVDGTTVLTLDNGANPPIIAATNATQVIRIPIAGTKGLTKVGPAQLTLSATNTLTGGISVLGGTLLINDTSLTPGFTNALFPNLNDLTLAGATVNLNEPANQGNHGQRFSNVVVNAGQSSMGHNRGSNGKGFYFIDGPSMTRSAGGTLDVPNYDTGRTLSYATNAAFPTNIALANGVAYVTGNGFGDWAGKLGSDNTFGPARGIIYTASTTVALAGNANIVATNAITLSANTGITSLRYILASNTVVNLGGFTLTNGGTLLSSAVTVNNGLLITNGTLLPPPNQDVVLIQNGAGSLNVAATIADNGTAAALTKSAGGTVILSGNNTYSGTTFLNAGTIQVGAGGTSGSLGSSALVQGQGGTLSFNRSDAYSFGGSVVGPIGLTKSAANTLTLTADGLYTGVTTISAGTLQLGNGGTAGSVSNSSSIANSGTLAFNRSSALTYSGSITGNGAIVNQGSGAVTLNAPINGATASVANSSGGRMILNSTNNYTGNTVISAGALVLGADAGITNSLAIIVSAGAKLDVSALTVGSLNLNGSPSVKQALVGSGVVTGSVLVAGSAVISPATNGTIGTLSISNNLTLSGGNTYLDITSSAVLDQIIVGGTLALNAGTLNINVTGTPLANGAYTLLKYPSSSLSGSANNMTVSFTQAGSVADLDDSVAGQIRLIVSSATPNNLVWGGSFSADWDSATFNWTNGVIQTNYASHDNVTFNDSGVNTTVNLTGALKPGVVLVNNSAVPYAFVPSAAGNRLSGGASLVKSGNGTLTLTALNDYSGATTINAGTVVLGDNGGNSGTLGSGACVNNGSLEIFNADSQIISAAISGSGSLTNDGAGITILSGNNSYTGNTIINGGGLQIGLGGAAGTLGTGTVTNNSTLVLNRSGNLTVNNVIAGTGTLAVNGSGTVTLGAVSSYANNTYISNGVLKLAVANAIPSSATEPTSTGWLVLDGGSPTAGVFDLNGLNQTVNALSGVGGTVNGVITNGGTVTTTTNILTVLGSAVTAYNGAILDNPTGSKVGLTLLGVNELRLNGNCNYSGPTLVASGATLGVGPGYVTSPGTLVLSNNATFYMHNNLSTSVFPGNNILIPDNSAGTLYASSIGSGFAGTVAGSSTATNIIANEASQSVSLSTAAVKQFQSLNGTVVIAAGQALRFSSTSLTINGGDNATFNIDGSMNTRNGTATGAGISLGALNGTGSLNGAGNADGNGIYVIGAKGIDSTFSGSINGVAPRATALVKTGAGVLTLSGSLTYDGATTINNGKLVLDGAAELDDSPTITLVSNVTLNVSAITTLNLGNAKSQNLIAQGSVIGNVSANSGFPSSITPGTAGTAGTLAISGDLTLNDTTTNVLDFAGVTTVGSGVNDLIIATNNLTLSGVVVIRPNFLTGGVILGQPYTIIKYFGALTGDTNNLALDVVNTPYSHLTSAFSTNTAGAITVTFLGTSNLVWVGDSTNNWQVGGVTNWFDGSSSNYFGQYDKVRFTDSASNFTAVLVGTLMPNGITVDASSNYVFSGAGKLSGSTTLVKAGTGTLTLTNTTANDFSGATVVSNGVIYVRSAGALSTFSSLEIEPAGLVRLGGFAGNVGGLSGAGAIDNNGAAAAVLTVGSLGNGVWSGTISNSGAGGISLALNDTNNLVFSGVNKLNSATASQINNGLAALTITNSGAVSLNAGEFWIGSQSATTGKVVVAGGSLVVSNWLVVGRGFTNANGTLIVNNGTVQKAGLSTVNLVVGSLGATGNLTVNGGQVLNNGMLWIGEGDNANATVNLNGGLLQATQVRTNGGAVLSSVINFNGGTLQASAASANFIQGVTANVQNGGLILDDGGFVLSLSRSLLANGTGGLIKQGAGTVYLDAANTYTGTTVVTNGRLAGVGTIAGPVAVGPAGSLGAGDAGLTVGKLTINNSLNLQGGSFLRISKTGGVKTNDQVVGLSAVTYGSTLTISNVTTDLTALAPGDTFTLFSATTHNNPGFTSIVGSPGSGLGYTFTNGVLSVVTTVNPNPTNLVASVSGNLLTLSWPADHTGWKLQIQTNGLSTGLNTNWVTLPGSDLVNTTNLTINPANGAVFYRMVYP